MFHWFEIDKKKLLTPIGIAEFLFTSEVCYDNGTLFFFFLIFELSRIVDIVQVRRQTCDDFLK